MLSKIKNHWFAFLAAFAVAVAVPGDALAAGTAQYSLAPVTSGIVDQVQDALSTILPIAGGLLALGIAWKLLRRMAKA